MKIFVDANILVSVLNKEYPLFTITARILSLPHSLRHQLYTSPLSLAIAYYFAEKKSKAAVAKQKIHLLCQQLIITTLHHDGVSRALSNPSVTDFEDGLQYYSALDSGCTCIVTENKSDFFFADIEVLSSNEFFMKYMAVKK